MSNSNKSTHKLVVIMFTDIVGYSKLVQINEDTALELLVEIFKRPGYLHWRIALTPKLSKRSMTICSKPYTHCLIWIPLF